MLWKHVFWVGRRNEKLSLGSHREKPLWNPHPLDEQHHWNDHSEEGSCPARCSLATVSGILSSLPIAVSLSRLSRHFWFGNYCTELLLLKITQSTWFGLPLSLFSFDSSRWKRRKDKFPQGLNWVPSSPVLYQTPIWSRSPVLSFSRTTDPAQNSLRWCPEPSKDWMEPLENLYLQKHESYAHVNSCRG